MDKVLWSNNGGDIDTMLCLLLQFILTQKSLLYFLLLRSWWDDLNSLLDFTAINKSFPLKELNSVQKSTDETKDAGEADDDDESDNDVDQNDVDDDDDDDDSSGEEESESDTDEEDSTPESSGESSDDDDESDDDEDEDDEDEDDEEEDEKEEQGQPPSMKKP